MIAYLVYELKKLKRLVPYMFTMYAKGGFW
jgi:hypothetical protein